MIIGYTAGVYDLFHIGHLNLFKNAKGMCDKLIVGVTVDELVAYKGKKAMIPFEDRIELVRSWLYFHGIPHYKSGRTTLFRRQEIEAWIERSQKYGLGDFWTKKRMYKEKN